MNSDGERREVSRDVGINQFAGAFSTVSSDQRSIKHTISLTDKEFRENESHFRLKEKSFQPSRISRTSTCYTTAKRDRWSAWVLRSRT